MAIGTTRWWIAGLGKCLAAATFSLLIPLGYAIGPILEGKLLIDGRLPDPVWMWFGVYVMAVMAWTIRYCDRSWRRTAIGLILTGAVVLGWLISGPAPAPIGFEQVFLCAGATIFTLAVRGTFYLAARVAGDSDPWIIFSDS